MNSLILFFHKKEYPYKDELYDPNIIWGEIILNIFSENQVLVKNVLKIEWDIIPLVKWLEENENKLIKEELPFKIQDTRTSISKAIYGFYNQDELCNDDKLINTVFNYRVSHGLRFALRGTDIDDVYIGKNNGLHEVSFYNELESWQFVIDISAFFEKVKVEFASLSK